MGKIYEIKDIQKERIGLIKNETSNHGKRPKINLRRIINQIEQEEKEELLKMQIYRDCYFNNYYNAKNEEFCLKENESKYFAEDEKMQHSNDKIMRSILKAKKQVATCLNKWLKIEDKYKITENELEEVTENYITKNWDDRTTDIVYKDKKYEGVFYLIEHQTEINYSMAQRIAEYKNEIRRNYQKNEKIKNSKEYKVAKVIAIVLYTGDKNWNSARAVKKLEADCPRIKENDANDYKLVKSKDFTISELEEEIKKNKEDILARIFFIDKIGETKDTNQIEKDIGKLKLESNHIEYIAAYINNIIVKKYGKETANLMERAINEKINKEEENDMLMEAFVDKFIEEGERRGITQGKKIGVDEGRKIGVDEGRKIGITQGISQVAINMLKEKCDKEMIKKYTGLSYAKISKLEKSLQRV